MEYHGIISITWDIMTWYDTIHMGPCNYNEIYPLVLRRDLWLCWKLKLSGSFSIGWRSRHKQKISEVVCGCLWFLFRCLLGLQYDQTHLRNIPGHHGLDFTIRKLQGMENDGESDLACFWRSLMLKCQSNSKLQRPPAPGSVCCCCPPTARCSGGGGFGIPRNRCVETNLGQSHGKPQNPMVFGIILPLNIDIVG